jgi:hypothetical protein
MDNSSPVARLFPLSRRKRAGVRVRPTSERSWPAGHPYPDPHPEGAATRIVLLVLNCVVCLLTGCQSQPKSLAPKPRPHVILIRGFQDWYSTGIDKLADELCANGIDATVYAQADSKSAGDALLAETPHPLVLIGFSYGADDVVRISRRLMKANKTVDLLVAIDPVTPPKVPANVARCVNYYQSNGARDVFPWLRGIPLSKDDPDTPLYNFDLRKDRTDLLQPDTSHATIASHQKLHDEIVARTVGVVRPARTLSGSNE